MARVTAIVVGTGGFARSHIRSMLKQGRTTRMVGFVEVSDVQREEVRKLFADAGAACPPFHGSVRELVRAQGPADAALICTPHKYHAGNIIDCLKAGMDVLVEKPMVIDAAEARRVMRVRDRTGRLLSVAFPGSYSPGIHKARELIAAGEIGPVVSISAYVHQAWKRVTTGTWRQDLAISGGGFLFDTGSHMVNTVVDLAGVDVAELSAVQDKRGTPVEILSAISGRFKNGVVFTLCAAGDSVNCQSRVVVMGEQGVLVTGIWGECLQIIRLNKPEPEKVDVAPWLGVWERFLKVRAGKLPDPCPAEVGLRFARLMDLVKESVKTGRAAKAGRK
jgi:predicted dehydrogenase